MTELLTCQLCYAMSDDVKTGLAWYREAEQTAVQVVDRCADHEGCRRRVEADGKPWPLVSWEEARA